MTSRDPAETELSPQCQGLTQALSLFQSRCALHLTTVIKTITVITQLAYESAGPTQRYDGDSAIPVVRLGRQVPCVIVLLCLPRYAPHPPNMELRLFTIRDFMILLYCSSSFQV